MKTRSLHIDNDLTHKPAGWIEALKVRLEVLNDYRKSLDAFLLNEFVFSPRYRITRHVVYWTFHVTIWAVFWTIMNTAPVTFWRYVFNMILWVPIFILFGYPLAYWAVPRLLFKGKVVQFFLIVLAWGAVGLLINGGYRTYIYVPIQIMLGFEFIPAKGFQPHSYLCMTTSAASPMIVKFFKLWSHKQKEWMETQQEKIAAELQLLKAQVHPHFLFNSLNNIYSFSADNSPKTPGLILKLSSLLSYMLYDCNTEQVRLEKEVEMMKNYIDLESERHGSNVDVSWSVDGNIRDSFISPLLMLPFLENAFKHCMAVEVERHWISVDISVKSGLLRCKVANSKSEFILYDRDRSGLDISNVKRRLAVMYPENHELKMHDEGDFFVVSLLVKLNGYRKISSWSSQSSLSSITQVS
ncbi:histidine kinase [Chryseolinea sp. T2]|uniref:sensor histidine kinase n=1 Tax=Chryseolinea sp. T2 TaxID=3129255 RepID=UPI003077F99B